MAKKPVKKAAKPPAKKIAKPAAKVIAKPVKSASKSATLAKPTAKTSKPASKSVASAKVATPRANTAKSTTAKTSPKPAPAVVKNAGKARPSEAKPVAAKTGVASASIKTTASVAAAAVPAAKPTDAGKSSAAGKAAGAGKPSVKADADKSTAKPLSNTPTAGKGAKPAATPEPVKTGRPMLLQGPIAVRPMGKKATLIITPPKPKPKPVKRRPLLNGEQSFVVVQPPTKAVATSEKAAKNKAGLSQKELDEFRDLLLAKRRELVGDMSSMEREALRENSSDLSNLPVHMADQGTDAYEQEFTLHLVEKDRTLLRELNDALAKIQNGTYGICEGTGLPISKPRLEAQPWARHSIEHARALEKRQMMFRR